MIRVQSLSPVPSGNPFRSDVTRMGTQLGMNVTAMHHNHRDRPCQHLVLVNTTTGERLLVQFLPDTGGMFEMTAVPGAACVSDGLQPVGVR